MTKSHRHPTCKRHRFPRENIANAVWLYFNFNLSYRDGEMKLAERQIPSEEQSRIDVWKSQLAELTDKQKGLKQARAGNRNQLERAKEAQRKVL